MVVVKGDILIERPPEDVFDFVADEENEPRYNPEMRYAKKVTEGPTGIGTTYEAEVTARGKAIPMTIRFTDYDRPHRLAERVHMDTMDLTGGLTFEPIDGGTRMRWSWSLQPHGALRFMGPLVARLGRRQEQRIWTSLKRLLEAEEARLVDDR
jgi:uncharacterized protein YndB with AHSA1/START domain